MNTTPARLLPYLPLLLIGATVARGQQPPETELTLAGTYSARSDARLQGQDSGELAVSMATLTAQVGSFSALDGHFTYGPSIQWLGVDGSNSLPLPDSIAGAALNLGYSRPVFGDKFLTASIEPGVFGNGFSIGGSVFVRGKSSETFAWAAGFVWNANGEFPIIPAAGFIWTPDDRWTVALRAPKAEVVYQLDPNLSAGFGVGAVGGTFKTKSVPKVMGVRDVSNSWFDYWEVRVGPSVTWKIDSGFTVTADAGWVVDRRFEFEDEDVTLRTDDTVYFGLTGNWSW